MVNIIADCGVASISIEEVSSYSHPAVITFDIQCMHAGRLKTKKVTFQGFAVEKSHGTSHISPRWPHTASGHLRRKL